MSNTYTKIYIMVVFAVKYRRALLNDYVQQEAFNIMAAALRSMKCVPVEINGMPDHVHILYSLHPSVSISETVKQIKRQSSSWINQQSFFRGSFAWQEGYGAFSYSQSVIENVRAYIKNQKIHHQNSTFMTEYRGLLDKYNIEYEEEYLLKDPI